MKKTIPAPHGGAPRVVLALAVVASLSWGAAAEELPEVELAPVTVSALGGLAVPYDQKGVSVTVLDIEALKKEGIYSLSEAMTTVPGVFALPGGGLDQRGNVNNVSLRGMQGAQTTLPMMDGMRLYSASNGMNLTPNVMAHTELFALGAAEVLRGAQGAVYGAGALGGVVYMETPEGRGEPSLTLFNEAGSFDSYTGNLVAQGQVDKLSFYLSATCERTNNDIEYVDKAVPLPKHAGRYVAWHEALRLDYAANEDNRLTLTWRREDADLHSATAWHSFSYCNFRTNLLTARWQASLSERWTSSLMSGYHGVDYMFNHGNNPNLRNVQVEWRHAYQWNENSTTSFGVAWNRSDYRCLSSWDGASLQDTLDNTCSLFVEQRFSPVRHWENSLALRWDQSSIYEEFITFRAATCYRFNEEQSRVFASVGNGYQTPYAMQRGGYYEYVNSWTGQVMRYVGNPELDCTRSVSADVGGEHEFIPHHRVGVTAFWSRLMDGIIQVPQGACTSFRNENGHWTIQGVELSLQGSWEEAWNTGYRLAFTFTQPMNSQARQLAESSRQLWSADVHTSPLEALTLGVGVAAASGRTDWNCEKLDAYCIMRCYARYVWNENLAFHLRVENLTDQRFESSSTGGGNRGGQMLNSGAAVYAGCTLTF